MAPSVEDMNDIYNELGLIIEKQERRVRYFETTSIKLATAYVFIQGLIFMSISEQNPSISCEQRWIPSGLSSLVAVIFAMTFNRFIGKWERTQYHLDMSFVERESIHHKMVLLKEYSSTYDQLMKQQPEDDEILKCDMVRVYQRTAFVWIVTSALFVYTALIVTASRSVLCHRV